MTWCFSTKASVAAVLSMHPSISSCLLVKILFFLMNIGIRYPPPLIELLKNISFETIYNIMVNSLRPSDAYMHHQTQPSLLQIMVCRLFSAKPIFEPMFTYCQWDPKEQNSVKLWSKFEHFLSRKYVWKCCLQIWRPFCLSLSVLKNGLVIHQSTWVKIHVMVCPHFSTRP